MELRIAPGNPLHGEVHLPGDKSISHRAALFAALADGESRFENFLVSGVTNAMLGALSALGVSWSLDGENLRVRGVGLGGLKPPVSAIDCGGSGTTMRLLAGALAGAGIPAVLDGSAGLRKRPMQRVVTPLQEMGVLIEASEGKAPLRLYPPMNPLRAIDYTLPVASAQVKSCLLLAALSAHGTTTLREPGPSRDHSERMLAEMGVDISREETSFVSRDSGGFNMQYTTNLTSPDPPHLKPLVMRLPADFSSAAFLIIAGLITPGSQIILREVGLNPTRTGLLDALLTMGAQITIERRGERAGEPVGDLTVKSSVLKGTHISGDLVVRMIDEFPAFSIAAAYAEGESVVAQAEELRHKESDRISVLCKGLNTLGVSVQERRDGFRIQGGHPPLGGTVDAYGDHRLGMAFAITGLASTGTVTVRGAQVIAESFPGFVQTLRKLNARMEMTK